MFNDIRITILSRLRDIILRLSNRLSERQLLAVLAVVVGLLAGLGTCLFEMLLHGVKEALVAWFPSDQAQALLLVYPAIGIILATLFVKHVVRDEISEGVTRVLYAMARKDSRIASHNCWSSIVGGATTIGFGGSVGPEAPIVLTGAAIGSNVGKIARLNYTMLWCGSGCGGNLQGSDYGRGLCVGDSYAGYHFGIGIPAYPGIGNSYYYGSDI